MDLGCFSLYNSRIITQFSESESDSSGFSL